MLQKIYAFIPNFISNSLVVNVLHMMCRWQRRLRRDYSGHLAANEQALSRHAETLRKAGGYIEDQRNYTDMAYGKVTMQYAGCEIFAAYNAILRLCGREIMSLPEMIAEHEKNGMILSGKFGTSPKAVREFLERHGFTTEFTTKPGEFDALGSRSESLILTFYNDRYDIRREVHTVSVTKKDGKYFGHNVSCDGRRMGPCESVSNLLAGINDGRAKGICLIGVKRAS